MAVILLGIYINDVFFCSGVLMFVFSLIIIIIRNMALCYKAFSHILHHFIPKQAYHVNITILPIKRKRKIRFRDVKYLAWRHSTKKQQNSSVNHISTCKFNTSFPTGHLFLLSIFFTKINYYLSAWGQHRMACFTIQLWF